MISLMRLAARVVIETVSVMVTYVVRPAHLVNPGA
jgi:hypothetical protein